MFGIMTMARRDIDTIVLCVFDLIEHELECLLFVGHCTGVIFLYKDKVRDIFSQLHSLHQPFLELSNRLDFDGKCRSSFKSE